MAKKRRDNAQDVPASALHLRKLYDRGMAELMSRQGVASIDQLEMSPAVRRLHARRGHPS